MKKIISVTLSLLMLLSCFTAVSVSALEAGDIADMVYDEASISASKAALSNFKIDNLPENFNCEIRDLPAWTDDNPDNDVDLLGMDLDYLYNNEGEFIWSFFDVFKTDENGLRVLKITVDDISLAVTNLNIYLQRVFYSLYGGIGLYTPENAAGIANLIGGILRPSFKKLSADDFRVAFNNKIPTSNEFYNSISKLSGLGEIITYNWISKPVEYYRPVIDALGGKYVEFFEEYYSDGLKLGAKIIEAAVSKINAVGPIEFIMDLLNVYAASYDVVYRAPTLDLFTYKMSTFQSVIPVSELLSFDGLLKLIFCNCELTDLKGCFAEPYGQTEHFCPIEFPLARYNRAGDATEKIIYLYYYLNLCGAHRGNKAVVDNWKKAIDNNAGISETDKTRIKSFIDGIFLGKFDETIDNTIVPLYKENISTATDSLIGRFKNMIMNFLKKIADYFDYLRKLFNGEIIYGQGNSPFN